MPAPLDTALATPLATADLRWLRALVVAGLATTIGVVAHVGAGGLLPDPAVLLTVLGVLVVVSAAALGGPASYGVIAGLVVGGQLVVHLVLSVTAGHTGEHGPAVPGGDSPGHVVGHLVADLTGPHLLMTAAHVAAALVVAGWLLGGERALWTMVALLGRHVVVLVLRPVAVHAVPPDALARSGGVPVAAPLRALLSGNRSPVGRRGPPVRVPDLAAPAA